MEVEFVQTLEDQIAFNNYHQASQPWWRRNARVLMVGLLMLILTGFLLIQTLSPRDHAPPPGQRALTDLPGWDQAFLLFLLVFPLTLWVVLSVVWSAGGRRYLVSLQLHFARFPPT